MQNITKLFIDLATKPDVLVKFSNDPEGTMGEYNLSESEIAAIKSGDADQIREAMGSDSDHYDIHPMFIIFAVPSGGDS